MPRSREEVREKDNGTGSRTRKKEEVPLGTGVATKGKCLREQEWEKGHCHRKKE